MIAILLLAALQNSVVDITIDATRTYSISPYIYGANFPEWDKMNTPFPFVRLGGNRTTAYNWETNASNAGNDYHHQNDGYMGESNEPGWTVRTFLEPAQAHGAVALVTVPTAGYVSADKNGDGDVNQTPNYLEARFFRSVATKPGGKLSLKPDTSDRVVYQDEFVNWVEHTRSPKLPVWYSLDNEPDLWNSTHARIHPKPATYVEIIANSTEFGGAIKRVAPKALVFGPANYGWQGFRKFQDAPDGNGRDFLDAYLDGMKSAEQKSGKRILDVLDIHWYPEAQGDGVRICFGDDKPGTPAARIQAPRSLWDPTYVEKSWITDSNGGKPLALLPGIMSQIKNHYPGTKFGITEYNYGGPTVISGALAQADVLGIFGREGLFAATNFGLGSADVATLAGFRAFLNYDGNGARFGATGLAVSGGSAERNSVYASLDKDKLVVVCLNKSSAPSVFRFRLNGFKATSGQAFVITSSSLGASTKAAVAVSGGVANFEAPKESVTTIVLSK